MATDITDGEKRIVAAALRGMHDYETANNIVRMCLGLGPGMLMDKGTRRRLSDRIADLIEPSCDREALLSVARGLEAIARSSGDGFEPVLSGGGCMRFARRIREACGEVDA